MTKPKIIILFGPPAVGKMTVGQELAKLIDYKLFFNHQTIDILLPFFKFGSRSFQRLNQLFREELFKEIVANDSGLIFTFVWVLNNPHDKFVMESYIRAAGVDPEDALFIELYASQEIRLERNKTENRLNHKPTKRELADSENNLLQMDSDLVMSTSETHAFPYPHRHFKIDNSLLSPSEAAEAVQVFLNSL